MKFIHFAYAGVCVTAGFLFLNISGVQGQTGPVVADYFQATSATSTSFFAGKIDAPKFTQFGKFHPYYKNPILKPSPGEGHTTFSSVVKDGNTWHMFYSYRFDRVDSVGHATSQDGKTWVKDTENNPIFEKSSTASDWDGNGVQVPVVWKESDTWYMLYHGNTKGTPTQVRIGLATSQDAVNWTRYNTNKCPGTTGDGCVVDRGMTTDPSDIDPIEPCFSIMKENGTYYMYYSSVGVGDNRETGLATSEDRVNWTKDARSPMFSGGRFCPNVWKYGDFYYMAMPHYTIHKNFAEFELYRDTSPVFSTETSTYLGVIKKPSANGWDNEDMDTPWVVTDDISRSTFNLTNGEIWMYYDGDGLSPNPSGDDRGTGLLISVPTGGSWAGEESTSAGIGHGQFSIVGIGTSTPYQKLSVAGGNIHVGGIVISTSTTAASQFPFASSTVFSAASAFITNAFFPFGTWHSSGAVSIGTSTSPFATLTIKGRTLPTSRVVLKNFTSAVVANDIIQGIDIISDDNNTMNNSNPSVFMRGVAEATHTATSLKTGLSFGSTNAGEVAATERVRISGSGNVGIGTSAPAVLLDLFSSGTTTVRVDSGSVTQGGCIMLKDQDGSGYTQIVANNGVLEAKIAANPNVCN